MAWVQKFSPDLGTEDYPGWCLRFTQTAWNAPVMYYCARESWDNSGFQHTDGLPSVAVPVYWSWWGTINGETRDWGHVAVLLPDGRVLSSPLTWAQGYGQQIVSSVDEVSRILGATFLGWTEDMNGLRVVDFVADPTPTPEPTPEPVATTYTVGVGDNLWGIAVLFYGDGTRWTEIYDANAGTIGDNPSLIQPGMVLTIPGV